MIHLNSEGRRNLARADIRSEGGNSRPRLWVQSLAAAVFALVIATAVCGQDEELASDGVPILPAFVSVEGEGILRYSDPQGREGMFAIMLGGLIPEANRPFEGFTTLGEFRGPDISLCLQGMSQHVIQEMNLAAQVFSQADQAVVARFRISVDPERAEDIVSTDGGTGAGECTSEFLR